MTKGIVRNLDDLGRVTLPKEMRTTVGLATGDPVDIYFNNGVICIEPCRLQCVCCGSIKEYKLVQVNGVHMCPTCIKKYVEVKG